jgi:hypothetical protein
MEMEQETMTSGSVRTFVQVAYVLKRVSTTSTIVLVMVIVMATTNVFTHAAMILMSVPVLTVLNSAISVQEKKQLSFAL